MKISFLGFLLISFISLTAQTKGTNSNVLSRPKLVVGIVVDQMRWDYLYRYYDRYQSGGFKRFLNEGFTCENTYIDYIPTITAIGHSTIYTGSVPAIHGIAGNEYIVNATGDELYCTADASVETVGSNSREGKMSPRNLLSSTITDELRLATNFRSKVIGIALKDRGAILPAGHAANAAYWLDNATGNWISSTYYMNELPGWVKQFNGQKLVEKYLNQDWNPLYPVESYLQSSSDDNAYEGLFPGKTRPVFPIKTSAMHQKDFSIIRTIPQGNSITIDFAKEAIRNEGLGKDSATDFLAISFSSTDYIGHKFGVNAIETEDTYLRLDKDLEVLFKYLDKEVGTKNYTVFLTADHGAAHNSQFLVDNKIPAGLWSAQQLKKDLSAFLETKYHVKDLVLSALNSQVHLNHMAISKNAIDEKVLRELCVDFIRLRPETAFAVDMDRVQEASIPEAIKALMINGYHRQRSGCIQIILKPGWISGTSVTGTGHGTWNPYDAHIPLLWMGWGIKKGKTNRQTNMTDIAATLAALLHIQEPNGNIGKPISEVLK